MDTNQVKESNKKIFALIGCFALFAIICIISGLSTPKPAPFQFPVSASQTQPTQPESPWPPPKATPKPTVAEKALIRTLFAKVLDTTMLEQGQNVEVTANGTTLTIKWPLVNRVAAYQMSKQDEIFEGAWDAWFDRIVLTDGFSSISNDTYTFDLRKLKRNR